jgi:hypothetical protein
LKLQQRDRLGYWCCHGHDCADGLCVRFFRLCVRFFRLCVRFFALCVRFFALCVRFFALCVRFFTLLGLDVGFRVPLDGLHSHRLGLFATWAWLYRLGDGSLDVGGQLGVDNRV